MEKTPGGRRMLSLGPMQFKGHEARCGTFSKSLKLEGFHWMVYIYIYICMFVFMVLYINYL